MKYERHFDFGSPGIVWLVSSDSVHRSLPAISPSVAVCSRGLRVQQSE